MHIDGGAQVEAGNSVLVDAELMVFARSSAQAATVGGLAVSASIATTQVTTSVSASIGAAADIRAGTDLRLESRFNITKQGLPISNTVQATSSASAGTQLLGILAGADSEVTSNATATTSVGSGALLHAGSDLTVSARAHNSVLAQSFGNADGLFAVGGSSGTKTQVTANTTANTFVGANARLEAGDDLAVTSMASTQITATARGSAGSNIADALEGLFKGNLGALSVPAILGVGGTSVEVSLNNTANTDIGTGAVLNANDDLTIRADAMLSAFAQADMSASAVFAADGVSAASIIGDSDALIRFRSDSGAAGGDVQVVALNQMDATAFADTDVTADIVAGISSAVSRVVLGSSFDPSEARITLDSGTNLTGRTSLLIEALNIQKTGPIVARARAEAFGSLTSTATSRAEGTVQVRSTIESAAGSSLTASDLTVHAESTYSLNRIPISHADTVVSHFVEVAREVTSQVCGYLPWPLNHLCKFVTEIVIDLVEVFDFSTENASQGGAGLIAADTINLNGDIFGLGGGNRLLIVNADGSIDPASNIPATIVGNDIFVGDVVNESQTRMRFLVPKGNLIGVAVIHVNKVIGTVQIENNTDKNLIIQRIEMVSDNQGEPDVQYDFFTGTPYEFAADILTSILDVDNNGIGFVLFTQPIRNVTGFFDIFNLGGDLRTAGPTVVLESGDSGGMVSPGGFAISLVAQVGDIGSTEQRFNVSLVRGKVMPDGSPADFPASLFGFAGGDLFLDVSGVNFVPEVPGPGEVVDGIELVLESASGEIDVLARAGRLFGTAIVETTHFEQIVLNEGTPFEIVINVLVVEIEQVQIDQPAHAIYDFVDVLANSGDVRLDVAGDLNAGVIQAPQGTADLSASASILDADADPETDVVAVNLILTAQDGQIGTLGNPLEIDSSSTQVGS
ncbi:MAG TPA: hypothetical protein VGA66_16460, partial [Mycobacterium sp.]